MSDDIINKMLENDPLLKFSLYTSSQIEALIDVGDEIKFLCDNSSLPDAINASDLKKAYNRFWLWVLGAYEVVRTMDENKNCFTKEIGNKLHELKKHLAKIRMPFAKQQYRGKDLPIYAELSIWGHGPSRNDMIFNIEGQNYSAIELIDKFITFIKSIKLADIIKPLPVGSHGNH